MKNQRRAISWALIAVFFWSTVASAFKIALRSLSPFQLILIASSVSLVTFFLIIAAKKKLYLLSKVSRREIFLSAAQGLFNPFLYYLILFKAYALNPAQVTQSLNMIWPVTLALFSALILGQKITWQNVWGILLSFMGVVFIASQGSVAGFYHTDLTGAGLALGSSVVWSLYWVLSMKDKLVVLFYNFCFGLTFLLIFGAFDGEANFYFQLDEYFFVAIYVGLFELGITYVIWMKALEYSENNAVTGNFIFLAPFLSLVFIYFILNETIHVTTFLGLIFIVLGIFAQQLRIKEQKPE